MKMVCTIELTLDENKLRELGVEPKDITKNKMLKTGILDPNEDGSGNGVVLMPFADTDLSGVFLDSRLISAAVTRYEKKPVVGVDADYTKSAKN